MTVQCPRCATEYRLPSRGRSTRDARYRCARCQHVFNPSEHDDGPQLLEADDEAPPPDDERFGFEDESEPEAATAEPTRAETRSGRERPAREPTGTSTARFALRAVLTITMGYAVLSIYLYTHPDEARRLFGRVPLVGTKLAETTIDPANVQLTNLRGEYVRVQDDQLVFVISGIAINNSPVATRGIQIEGRVVGSREDRRVVFCGTAPRDVRDLSIHEIALLQTLEPPKDWMLGPGEQASFAVVFVGAPTDLREFAAEVVAVQGRRHRRADTALSRATERATS
jgi:predicted Zn finger-like uncharacterized protein